MKIAMLWIDDIIETAIRFDAFRVVKYVSPKKVIRATRRTYNRKIRKSDNVEILLTIGKPNFKERKFIKLCRYAGEHFPIKKIQMEYFKEKR